MDIVHKNAKSAYLLVPEELIEVPSFIVDRFWHFGHKTPDFIIGFIEHSQFAHLWNMIKRCQFKVQQNILIIILFISLKSCREVLVSTVQGSIELQWNYLWICVNGLAIKILLASVGVITDILEHQALWCKFMIRYMSWAQTFFKTKKNFLVCIG